MDLVTCSDCGRQHSPSDTHQLNCVKAKQRRALAVAQTADLNALAALPSGSGKKRQLDADPSAPLKKPKTSLTLKLGAPSSSFANNSSGYAAGSHASASSAAGTHGDAKRKHSSGSSRDKSITIKSSSSGGGASIGGAAGAAAMAKAKIIPSPLQHCHVPNPLSHLPCTRSLTCKSHSMAAKRAVVRGVPYDVLLAELQRINRGGVPAVTGIMAGMVGGGPKVSKAVETGSRRRDTATPLSVSLAPSPAVSAGQSSTGAVASAVSKERRRGAGVAASEKAKAAAMLQHVGEYDDSDVDRDEGEGEDGEARINYNDDIDSEEELISIFSAISRRRALPLAAHPIDTLAPPDAFSVHALQARKSRPGNPLMQGGIGSDGRAAASLFVSRNLKMERLRGTLGGVFGRGGGLG